MKGFASLTSSEVVSDTRTISAVLTGPAYLSGLDEEQRGIFLAKAIDTHASALNMDLKEATKARAQVEASAARVTREIGPKVHLWSNPEPTAMRQLRTLADGRS